MLQEMRIVDQCKRVLHYLIRNRKENYQMVNQWEMMEGKGFCLFPLVGGMRHVEFHALGSIIPLVMMSIGMVLALVIDVTLDCGEVGAAILA